MKYEANFATHEEYVVWLKTGKMPEPTPWNIYLKVEPIHENGFLFKAMLDYKSVSLYSLEPGTWGYLTKNDLRSIAPFKEFEEKKIPCYITFGESFYKVDDIQPNEKGILELVLQHAGLWNLN